MYKEFTLSGTCLADLDTEVRFNIADARADSAEIIRLSVALGQDERDNTRIENCLIRIFRSMMRADLMQFYVSDSDFEMGNTESEFMLNKYGKYIERSPHGLKYFYVKT